MSDQPLLNIASRVWIRCLSSRDAYSFTSSSFLLFTSWKKINWPKNKIYNWQSVLYLKSYSTFPLPTRKVGRKHGREVASRSGRLKYWFIRGGRQLGKKILALFHRFTQLLSLLYVYIYKDIYIHIYLSLENPDEIERFTFVRISRRNDSPNLSTFLLKINSSTKYFTCYWFSYSKEKYSISSSYSLPKYNFFHPESQSRSDKISRSYRDASNTTIIP